MGDDMRGDIPQAAFRLLTALPVVTHKSAPRAEKEERRLPSNTKTVMLDSVEYESVSQAAKVLDISRTEIRRRIKLGRGRLAE
jgi:DNA-directed RNA polymerase specialized sigma24 family protein